MKKVLSAALFGLLLGAASVAQSATIELTTIDGDWANATPVANATIDNSGDSGGTSTASWGSTTAQSSYVFVSNATPLTVEADGALFSIGTFTHNNYTIPAGTSITAIDLLLGLKAFNLVGLSATFNYLHDETTNTSDPDESRDIVTITNPILNADFVYDGNTYYFNLFGFSQDGGTTVSNEFLTYEGRVNTANLYAKVTTEAIPAVPEPATVLLFGAGLAGLAAVGRRRNQK